MLRHDEPLHEDQEQQDSHERIRRRVQALPVGGGCYIGQDVLYQAGGLSKSLMGALTGKQAGGNFQLDRTVSAGKPTRPELRIACKSISPLGQRALINAIEAKISASFSMVTKAGIAGLAAAVDFLYCPYLVTSNSASSL